MVTMEFSVVVPALNEESYIEECLRSISKQTLPRESYEIIVSDGASRDRTAEIARKYADKVIISERRGIWWGRNLGAKAAKGKYLAFIDADTRIKENYLETVQKHLDRGAVGLTAAYDVDGSCLKTRILGCMSCYCWWLSSKVGSTRLIGINLCVPREVFLKVGGFKNYALEDAVLDRELRKEGETYFLIKKLAVTSPRRLKAYGAAGLCRYYLELGLVDSGRIKRPYIKKYIKHQRYSPIR